MSETLMALSSSPVCMKRLSLMGNPQCYHASGSHWHTIVLRSSTSVLNGEKRAQQALPPRHSIGETGYPPR